MNALLLRLLKRHISPAQLLGFVLANLIGLGILLLGLQFYRDALTALSAKDSLMRASLARGTIASAPRRSPTSSSSPSSPP